MDVQAKQFDIIVIGAGIAGASVAAELAKKAKVVLLEREAYPGYHTTGRSAAIYSSTYGPSTIRGLTRASRDFYKNPNSEFATTPLLNPRGILFIARSDQNETLDMMAAELGDSVTSIDGALATEIIPLLRKGYVNKALIDKISFDIDVDTLHQIYLREFKSSGGELLTNADVTGLNKSSNKWFVQAAGEELQAPIVVNASGAWADHIAKLGGISPIGLVPKRRTAMLVTAPPTLNIASWPMVVDIDEEFYLKPDGGKLLLSPADETPSVPCDAQPEELDVAIGVDRIEKAFDLSIRKIDHKWAGLRSFVKDKSPVAGFDPSSDGFFWLAGQGGYGIQSAPALSRTAAALILGRDIPTDIQDEGITAADLSRTRMGLMT